MVEFKQRRCCERTTVNGIIVLITVAAVVLLVALLAGIMNPSNPTSPDPCRPNPCKNNGTCSAQGKSFQCKCLVGWTGSQCSISFNLAAISPGGNTSFFKLNTDGNEITGLAAIGDKLYVVCVKNDSIYVFNNSQPNERIESLEFIVRGMRPEDMAADTINNILYIIGWTPEEEHCIWKVDPITQNITYYANATHWIGSLSVGPDGRVLGVTETGRLILVGNSTATTLSLQLPASIQTPQHVVLSSDDVIYVSQGCQPGESLVSSLNSTTEPLGIFNQFGLNNSSDNSTLLLSWPRHLAVAAKGLVYVADYWNNRVVWMFSNLTQSGIAMDHVKFPEVGWPHRLAVTESGTILAGMTNKPMNCTPAK